MKPTCAYPNDSELQRQVRYGATWRELGAYALGHAHGTRDTRMRDALTR